MLFRVLLLIALALGIASPAHSAGFDLDINSREQVRAFYNTVFAASTNAIMNWTGDVDNCQAGTTSDDFKEQVRLRVNFYRAMAGVPSTIIFDPVFNAKCQLAALMMCAQNEVNHNPPDTFACHTADGDEASQKSNLALGFGLTGPGAIDGYMLDRGANNTSAGHRRWILLPQTTTMGTGDIDLDGAHNPGNALWVVDGRANQARPATRSGFVSWPPPGYMPSTIMPVRWTISYPGAGFSSATVTVSSNGIPVAVTKETVANGAGENTLVWFPTGMSTLLPVTWARPATDITFAVSVAGVTGNNVPTSFNYEVKMFDPNRPAEGEIVPTITGPAAVATAETSQYTFTSPAFATGNELKVTRLSTRTEIEGAENLLVNFANVTSPSTTYSNIVTTPVASGTKAFRLCHAGGSVQHLTLNQMLLATAGAELRLASKLGFVKTTEFAKIQISTDDGLTWNDVYSQIGSGSSNVATEPDFVVRTISLAQFENQLIKVRFTFTATTGAGTTFTSAAAGFGWYFDDISFVNTFNLGEATIETLPLGNQFTFAALSPGDHMLQVRARVWTDFAMAYGNVKVVTATSPNSMEARINGVVAITPNELQIPFSVIGSVNPVVKIFKAQTLDGEWTVDETATFEVVLPNSEFRATVPRPAADTFYRPGF